MEKKRNKSIAYILVFIILVAVFILYEKPQFHNPQGITFNKQNHSVEIVTVNETDEPYHILLDSGYQTTSYQVIEDSTLPVNENDFAKEFSFLGNLTDTKTQGTVNFKFTIRLFSNGDLFLMVRAFTKDSITKPVNYTLDFPSADYVSSEIWSMNYHNSPKLSEMMTTEATMDFYQGTKGINILPPSLNYVEMLNQSGDVNLSVLMGPLGVFKEKEINLVELMSQKYQPVLEIGPKNNLKISFSFSLNPYQKSENWFFLSRKRLINYRDDKTLQNMLSADLNMKKKLSFDGIYHIAIAQNYVGASDISYDYYYNYAMWEGRRFMDLYREKTSERFFKNMFMNSLYSTIKGASKYGYWKSNVRSQFLWDKYQIPEGYVDTRYCTDAGFFLLKAYNEFQIQPALNAGKKFGDYLIEEFEKGEGIKVGEKAFFFYDYYQPDKQLQTHASLNHILSELNYLYELYLSTHDEKYLGLSESILEGIRQTQNSWIRTTGEGRFMNDLWYSVRQSKGKLIFESHDYTKTLTYEDLLKAQISYRSIYNKDEPVLQRLIQSKRMFLIREGYKLSE
jgi:hypothetical protein